MEHIQNADEDVDIFPTGLFFYDVTLQNNISDVTVPAGVAKDAPAVRHLRFRIIL